MNDELIAFGNEVKALGNGKIGGVLVRMTTPDDPDLSDDFFSVKSDKTSLFKFSAELR